MELVSGKMPTYELFGAEMDMVRWVEMHMDMHGSGREELIDSELKPLFLAQLQFPYSLHFLLWKSHPPSLQKNQRISERNRFSSLILES